MKTIIKTIFYKSGAVFTFDLEGQEKQVSYTELKQDRNQDKQLLGERLFGEGFKYKFVAIQGKRYSKTQFEKYYNKCAI